MTTKTGLTAIRVGLSKELHMRLKVHALQNYTTLQALVPIALEYYLTQMAKSAQESQLVFKPIVVESAQESQIKPKVARRTKKL